jgi:hypothetical protein
MIQGTIKADGTVSFVKTYDGFGGIGHSVAYFGAIDDTGRRIRCKFNAQGNEGVFEMVR